MNATHGCYYNDALDFLAANLFYPDGTNVKPELF